MSYVLRDYQVQCSDLIFEKWREHNSTLLVLYTGGGKTIIFADVIRRSRPGRALVLANREELIFQAADKIHRATGLHCDIEMADQWASTNLFNRGDVVVSTVQTMISGRGERKRMHRFNPDEFGVLVFDEAHMSVAPTCKMVIDHFAQNERLKILGVTATPDRHDRESLGQIFKSNAANLGILDGIEHGWLCDITQQYVEVEGLDYSHIRVAKGGDLNESDLAAVMEAEENIMGVCQPSLEVMFALPPKTLSPIPVPDWGNYLRGLGREARRTIVFTASVAQAEMCANIFNRVVNGMADWVCGETQKDKRRELLVNFSNGKVRAVMNCGVLTHGFDDPGVEVIIMARPTQSRALYAQMVGRSTRPLPGVVDGPDLDTPEKRRIAIANSAKPYCRIVDFVGVSGRLKLVTTPDILGGRVSDRAADLAKKKAMAEGKPFRMARLLTKAEVELQTKQQAEAERRRRNEEARKAGLVGKADYSIEDINPFDQFHIKRSSPYARGYGIPATKNQVVCLANHGIDAHKHRLNRSEAGQIIDQLPATKRQINWLKWQKVPHDPGITMKQASQLIAKRKKEQQ
jgi:superfamily II DNA or RNA helicase